MAKEIIGFINKNNDIFNLRDDSSASKYCCKVGQGHENKIAVFTEDGNLKDSEYKVEDFAQTEHSHSQLILPATLDPTEYNRIDLEETEHQGKIYIRLYDTEDEDAVFSDYVTGEKLSNIFYPATAPVQGKQNLITSGAVYTALQGKVDKVENATAGNLASLNENGNLQDSGKKSSDFAAAAHGHKEIRQTNSDDELALVSATANEDGDLWIDLVLREVREPTKTAQITYDNIDNLKRALKAPSSTPEDDATKLITSKAVYDALLGKMANLRSMRITYNNVDDEFVVSESDKAVLVTFRNSAPADTFVPVLVSLYDGNTKDSDVFGLAKWSEEQQPHAIDINILVVIGNYYFSVNGDYQDIEDIRFAGWTRTVQGQSFFS